MAFWRARAEGCGDLGAELIEKEGTTTNDLYLIRPSASLCQASKCDHPWAPKSRRWEWRSPSAERQSRCENVLSQGDVRDHFQHPPGDRRRGLGKSRCQNQGCSQPCGLPSRHGERNENGERVEAMSAASKKDAEDALKNGQQQQTSYSRV